MKKTPFPEIDLSIANPLKKGFRFFKETNAKNSQIFNYPLSKN